MSRFKKIRHHVNIKDVKKKHLEKVVARKIKEEIQKEEQKYVSSVMKQVKYSWRKDISESDFTNITKGNTISQTFQHISGATITLDNTMSDTSEIPTQVTLDLGFGEKITVDAPSQNQFGITGVTRRLGITTSESGTGGGGGETVFDKVKELDKKVMQKQSAKTADEINQQLDASEKASGAETAKVQVDGEKSDDELVALQREGYYEKKLGPLLGNMTDARELRMNEKLIQENERENEIYKKNEVTRAKHQKVIDNKIKPLLDQINSGSDKKIDLKTLYQRGAVVNKDGTRGLMIRKETTSAMGLSITKTVITTYRGKNISTVGSVANREKLGITGQGKMTKVAEIKDPRLLEYKMPVELEMWQTQSIPYLGAMSRSLARSAAEKTNTVSAFNVLNYFIDNHVKTYAKFDPSRAKINHNLTHLYTPETKDILRSMVDSIKTNIDLDIKTGESNEKIRENVNNLLVERQPTDVSNSLGNAMGFDVDYYKQTGNYRFNSTYEFTSTIDMEPRNNQLGIGLKSVWPRVKFEAKKYAIPKYVAGQLYGETMMAVQNPMQFQVDIESGKQYSSKEPSKAVEKIKSMSKTRNQSLSLDEPIVRKRKKKRDT